MKVYLDSDYKCHMLPGEGLREAEAVFFDGKCRRFLEGYRYVPAGERWVRPDGTVFAGPMAAPWEHGAVLEASQEEYERAQEEISDLQAALETIYTGVI